MRGSQVIVEQSQFVASIDQERVSLARVVEVVYDSSDQNSHFVHLIKDAL